MEGQRVSIRDYDPRYAEEAVAMWRKSKEQAIGQKESHSFADQVNFLNHVLSRHYRVVIALLGEEVVGLAAYNKEEISQLYIHPDHQGCGIGKTLLEKIKTQSTGRLTLYTFQVNEKARRFYEKQGFKVIGSDYENEENLPDMLYEWTAENQVSE